MSFQISSLARSQFESLFALDTTELASKGACRMTVTKKPGFPCRISLADAEMEEEVILVHFEHQSAETPFRSSHAVFVRPTATQYQPLVDEVPVMFRSRLLSLRAFDKTGMMVGADVAEGLVLEAAVDRLFDDSAVAYIHLHFAKPGCYAARLDRA